MRKRTGYRDKTYWIIYHNVSNKYPELSSRVCHTMVYNILKKKNRLNIGSDVIQLPIPMELEKVVI